MVLLTMGRWMTSAFLPALAVHPRQRRTVRPSSSGDHRRLVALCVNGRDIFTYVFEALRAFQANAVPAVPLDALPAMVASVGAIVALDGLGIAISIRLEDLMKPDALMRIEGLATSAGLSLDDVDLVIDLGRRTSSPTTRSRLG